MRTLPIRGEKLRIRGNNRGIRRTAQSLHSAASKRNQLRRSLRQPVLSGTSTTVPQTLTTAERRTLKLWYRADRVVQRGGRADIYNNGRWVGCYMLGGGSA